MKYKVGDVVQLVSERPGHWNSEGAMDDYLNKVVKIKELHGTQLRFYNDDGWYFNIDDIVGHAKHPVVKEILQDL